jgi:hypothetical protein
MESTAHLRHFFYDPFPEFSSVFLIKECDYLRGVIFYIANYRFQGAKFSNHWLMAGLESDLVYSKM